MSALIAPRTNNNTDFDDFNPGKSECTILCGTFLVIFGIMILIYFWFCWEACYNRPVCNDNTELVEELLKNDGSEVEVEVGIDRGLSSDNV